MWMALLADDTLCGSLLDEKARPWASVSRHHDDINPWSIGDSHHGYRYMHSHLQSSAASSYAAGPGGGAQHCCRQPAEHAQHVLHQC